MTGTRSVVFAGGARAFATPQAVVDAWRAASQVDARYAVGTAHHESDFTLNEVDTEPSGFVSSGIFQLSDEERAAVGLPSADLLSLADSVAVLARLAERRLAVILAAAHLSAATPDCLFYLALAHNEGLGACLKTIKAHGLDAAAWVARNPRLAQAARYFSDCVTGGDRWAEVAPC